GVDLWVIDPKGGMEGLSPRARGRLAKDREDAIRLRTIPACAGPTRADHRHRGRVTDYPRVRGADDVPSWFHREGSGLSPRARGRRVWHGFIRRYDRTIPACAGPTR